MKVFFTSFATLQDVNGWPQRVIAQYYQVILNMTPLPWQKFVSKPYWTAQFKHKLKPPKPAEPPGCQQPQAEPDAEPSQPPKAATFAMAAQTDDSTFAQGYCKSLLAQIDPENGIRQAINQLKGMDLSPDVSDVQELEAIISQKLLLVEQAYAAQDATMQRISTDAQQMAEEQGVLGQLRLDILDAQEKLKGFLAQKKEEEQAQEELREEQAQQILSQMDAIGLSPEALLELHQKRQKDGKKPIPEDQVSEPPGTSKPEAAVPSEADRAEFESCGPATKKARLEEPQQSSEMVEVIVEEEIE